MTATASDSRAAVVALLTPTGRDAHVADSVLGRAGFVTKVCDDASTLCSSLNDDVGVLLVAEEALRTEAREKLLAALDAQPSWSDVPVVVLTGTGELSQNIPPALRTLADRANVTLLERPVRVATLVTALRSAMRARRRQFDLRDYLEEREAAEQALRESEERERDARHQAEEANRAKSQFLTTMSHELRTPLNAIAGYAQLLSLGIRGPVTEDQREDLERINKSQRHLLSLINDILNLAKIEAGRVDFNLRALPVRELLQSVEPLVRPQLDAKSLQFEDESANCDATVVTDAEKARQIVLNLLSNAIKFTPPQGRIRIACRRRDGMMHLAVSDTGIGIPGEKLAAIFEPFVQVERHFTSMHEGTGLGLTISRDLARRMGGDLAASGNADGGSTFTLTMPLAD